MDLLEAGAIVCEGNIVSKGGRLGRYGLKSLTSTRNIIMPIWVELEKQPIPDINLSFSLLLARKIQLGFGELVVIHKVVLRDVVSTCLAL